METQNSRGSSGFLGGFCALGWEKKLSILLQNAQLMSLMARTEKLTAVCQKPFHQKLSGLLDSSIYCVLWQSSLELLT